MTAAAARDAHRSNAGQKASALAESGINNALAVLNANYPGVTIYPGNANLLLSTTLTGAVTLPATTINVASTLGYNSGSNTISVGPSGAVTCTGITATSFTGCTGGVAGTYATGTSVARATAAGSSSATWSGTLVNVPTNPNWKWQWQLTASGRVKNPTGPAADVVRKATAVVPVVIPDSASVDPGTSAVDWIYALNDITFGQSVVVAAPVYTGHDLILENTATISETIPASLTKPARPNRIAVGHDLSLVNPQNKVGHVNGTTSPANDLAEVHVGHYCASKDNPTPHPCVWGATDKIWGVIHDNVIPPDFITIPTLTCCSPVAWAVPADGTSHPGSPSYMGFWYLNAGIGPKAACATSSGTPPTFDTGDDTINQSAYAQGTPFDLTGATYSCTSADGKTKLAWDATSRTFTIKGTVFIDGSATELGHEREVRRQGDAHPERALHDGQQHRALREPLGQHLRCDRAVGCRHDRTCDRRRRARPPDGRQHRRSRRGTSRGCSSATGTSTRASRAPSSSVRWSASTEMSTPARAARSSSRRSRSHRRARPD